jgi:hypothetical protein
MNGRGQLSCPIRLVRLLSKVRLALRVLGPTHLSQDLHSTTRIIHHLFLADFFRLYSFRY